MKKVLILLAHPNFNEESKMNKTLLNKAKELENITVENLYEKYPDGKIDVEAEQKLILENDVVIFQFPLYWFSSPALLRQWQDDVLTYNFAFGEDYQLEGKTLAVATTMAGAEQTYIDTGILVDDYLKPMEGIAQYVKMDYAGAFKSYNSYVITDEELESDALKYKEFLSNLQK